MADPESAPELYDEAVATFAQLLDYNLQTKAAGEEKGADLLKESKQYIAITFAEEKWGSFDKLQSFLEARGQPEYSGDLLIAFGNVLFDQTRYQDSVAVLKTYLNQEPMDPTAPELREKSLRLSSVIVTLTRLQLNEKSSTRITKRAALGMRIIRTTQKRLSSPRPLLRKPSTLQRISTTNRHRNMKSPRNMSLRLPLTVKLRISIKII